MHEIPSCHLLRTPEELQALRPAWEKLWRSDPAATPFQSPAWLLPWWSHFGQGSLRVVTVRLAGALRVLLPFYLYTEPLDGHRKLLPLGVATSDYLDGTFAPDCTPSEIRAALKLLLAAGDWDSLEIPQLRAASRLREPFVQLYPEALLQAGGERVSRLPAVPLPQLPQKIRRNVMYYHNRARRAGELELSVAGPQNWHEALETVERLHTARWNLAGKPGVFADSRVRAWHREAIPRLLAEGLVGLYSLRLNGETIAALYTLLDPPYRMHRTQYIYIPAFSPEHGNLRPGSIILALAMDHAATQGFSTVDMLRGSESYKDLWHPSWIHTDMVLLRRTAAAGLAA